MNQPIEDIIKKDIFSLLQVKGVPEKMQKKFTNFLGGILLQRLLYRIGQLPEAEQKKFINFLNTNIAGNQEDAFTNLSHMPELQDMMLEEATLMKEQAFHFTKKLAEE